MVLNKTCSMKGRMELRMGSCQGTGQGSGIQSIRMEKRKETAVSFLFASVSPGILSYCHLKEFEVFDINLRRFHEILVYFP